MGLVAYHMTAMSRSLSASSFRSLLHCRHALFLDHHGDPALKTDLGEFDQYLLDEGKRLEQEIIAGKEYLQPDYPDGDLDAGADATDQLMRNGVPFVYQGVLKAERLVGVAPLPDSNRHASGRIHQNHKLIAPDDTLWPCGPLGSTTGVSLPAVLSVFGFTRTSPR